MKKLLNLLGVLVFVAIIGSAFSACPQEPGPSNATPFEGVWFVTYHSEGEHPQVSYEFSGSNLLFKVSGVNYFRGTFTYTATQITIFTTHYWHEGSWHPVETPGHNTNYTISGNTITMSNPENPLQYFVLTKQ